MDVPQRRNTKFPGSSPVVIGKRPADNDIDSARLSASKITKVPKFLEDRQRVSPSVAPHFPVHPHSNQFSPASRPSNHIQQSSRRNFIHNCDPWHGNEYQAIFKEKKHGGFTVAHRQSLSHPIMAVTEDEYSESTNVDRLARCSHKNIVPLHEAYVDKEKVYLIYERMDPSLAEIQATPYGEFAAFQIATICKEVLNGLIYIHNDLKISYGALSANNVMISREGDVKLANIGQSMLGLSESGNAQSDRRSLGLLMVRLMERSTSLEDPDSLDLRRPELWDQEIKDFLGLTSSATEERLMKVEWSLPNSKMALILTETQSNFLDFSPESHWLKPIVLITERMVQRSWEPLLVKGKVGDA